MAVWLVRFLPIFPFAGAISNALGSVHFYDAPAGYTSVMKGFTDGKTQILGGPFTWGLLFYYLAMMIRWRGSLLRWSTTAG